MRRRRRRARVVACSKNPAGRRHLLGRGRLVPGAVALLVRQLPRPDAARCRTAPRLQRRPPGRRPPTRRLHPHADVEGLPYVVERHVRARRFDGQRRTAAARRHPAHDARAPGAALRTQRLGDRADAASSSSWIPARHAVVGARAWSSGSSRGRTGPTDCSGDGPEGGDVVEGPPGRVGARRVALPRLRGRVLVRRGPQRLPVPDRGLARLGEETLSTGDAAKIFGPEELSLRASTLRRSSSSTCRATTSPWGCGRDERRSRKIVASALLVAGVHPASRRPPHTPYPVHPRPRLALVPPDDRARDHARDACSTG